MGRDDEFAEFDTTEEEFDRVMARGEPVEVDVPSRGFNERLELPGTPSPTSTRSSGILVSNLH
ncbi:hypothetical protein [Streptomyces sp.]|uniref:hypothetical protein n=1 Tax=Streptomyces sp. TaxID=1931 RepID=UPI002F951CEA